MTTKMKTFSLKWVKFTSDMTSKDHNDYKI